MLLGREDVPLGWCTHPGTAQLRGLHVASTPLETKVLLYGTMQREMAQTELLPEGEMSLNHHLTQKGGDRSGGCGYTSHDPA